MVFRGVVVAFGISAFVVAKKSIDNRRYENMKIRERIRNASLGEDYPAVKSSSQWKIYKPYFAVDYLVFWWKMEADKMQIIQDLEIEMMADMYNRMSGACHKKCVPPKYSEPDLGKGEAVCIDRCVAKYLDIHDRVGKKLTALSSQDEELKKKLQGEQKWAAVGLVTS